LYCAIILIKSGKVDYFKIQMIKYIPETHGFKESSLDLDLLELMLSTSETSEWFLFLFVSVFGVLIEGAIVACNFIGV
jgi:hypothetical protein